MNKPKMSTEEFIRSLKEIPLEQILATGDPDFRAKKLEALARDCTRAEADQKKSTEP
jgi:hypothetical protein